MIIIKKSEIKSEDIRGTIREIEQNKNLFSLAKKIADKKRRGVYDMIEAIATHIVMLDEDYIIY